MKAPLILPIIVLGSLGCRSAHDFRVEADDEVYALVNDRREKLFAEEGDFSIDPPEDSLRARILEGEVETLEGLGLVECLEIAAENNREYQTRREALYLAALDVTLERWRLGWIANSAGDIGISGLGDTATTASGGIGVGFRKVLGTGASFLSDLGLAFTKDLAGGGGWTGQSTFNVLFTQPLMRGAGGWIVYEDLTQSERSLVYEVRSFERFRRQLSVDIAARLLRLNQSLDTIENERRNNENVSKIRERNESLSRAGRLSDIQVDQARQDELSSQDRLISAKQNYAGLVDSFKLLLGLPMRVDLSIDEGELGRLVVLGGGLDQVSVQEAEDIAYQNRPDFMTSVDQVVDAERRSRIAADALRMGLNVASSINVSSDLRNPVKFNFQDVSWDLGVLIDLPIQRMEERNAYRAALIRWQAATRGAQEFEDNISIRLRDLIREVKARRESHAIQASAVGLAEKRVESAGLNLQAGRASTRDLLEAQDSLVSSRNAEIRAQIEYTLARLDLALDMGILRVDESGIRIEDLDSVERLSDVDGSEVSE